MLCDDNESLESRNFVDGVDFTRDDPCLFVVYPPGAAGDLLLSIIDKHYLRTGCEYYGITDNGRVHFYTADYESIDLKKQYEFNDQWFYDLATSLGNRNLNYSLLDQIIFGCHMYSNQNVRQILNTFAKAKIIRILPVDNIGAELINTLASLKLPNKILESKIKSIIDPIEDERVLDVAFGALFDEQSYYKCYDNIIKFLDLKGRLICFDYVKYYLSKQHVSVRNRLIEYSKTL